MDLLIQSRPERSQERVQVISANFLFSKPFSFLNTVAVIDSSNKWVNKLHHRKWVIALQYFSDEITEV